MTNYSKARAVRFAAGVSLSALGMSAAPAIAQNADNATNDENVIVVVGVTKQDANVQDVPTTIAVFSGDQLAERNVVNVQDLAGQTSGLMIRQSPNNSSSINIGLRGQVQNDNLATVDPSVGVYVDGVYWARSYGLNSDLLDVRNVQLLKGPQGTLFGRNTSAGALVIESNDPDLNEFGGSLDASYGRFNEIIGTAVINLPIVEDRLAIRGAIRLNRRDGTTYGYDFTRVLAGSADVLTGERYNNRDVLQGRLRVLGQLTDDLELSLSAEWYDSEQKGGGRFLSHASPALGATGATLAAYDLANPDRISVTAALDGIVGFGPSAQGIYADPFTNTATQTYSAELSYDFGGATISFMNSYRKISSTSANDLDGTALISGNNEYTIRMDQFSSELQLAGVAFGDSLDYVVGATYLKEDGSDNSQGSSYSGPNYTTSNTFRSNIENEAFGVYAQGSLHITEHLDVVAGIRHSWDTRQNVSDNLTFRSGSVNLPVTAANYCLIPGLVASANGHCFFSASDSYEAWSYTAGLNYNISDDILIFAKTSKGYRAGAQQLRTVGVVGGLDTSIASLPEVNFEHEVGLKSQFMDRRVTFNASFYYNNVRNFQSTKILTIPGTSTRYTSVVNPGDLRNYGVEAELVINPAEGFSLFGSVALNDEAYENCTGGVCPDFVRDIVQTQFNIGASYSGDVGFAELGLNLSYNWTGTVPLDASYRELNDVALALFGSTAPLANPAVAAQLGALAISDAEWETIFLRRSVGTLDARASLAFMDGDLELYAFGRNLTNERYIQHTQYLFSVTTSSLWNDPRTYGVGLKFSF